MKQTFYFPAGLFMLGLAFSGAAQTPVITSRAPARNALGASATAAVSATLAQSLTASAAATLGVYSAKAGGKRKGSYSAADKTVTFNPASAFQAGETVLVTVPAAITKAAGAVYQFTTGVSGNGHAQNLVTTPSFVGQGCYSFATGDIDNDGDVDIVAVNQFSSYSNPLTFLLNGGDNKGTNTGVFSAGKAPALTFGAMSTALGDVDGDGDLDILLGVSSEVIVLRNGGDASGQAAGQFGTKLEGVTVGREVRGLVLGDVDGDGDLDLVSADSNGPSLTVCLNGGDNTGSNTGRFVKKSTVTPPVVGNAYGTPVSVVLADVDGDDDLDLLANNRTTVSVILNGGDAKGSNTGVFSGGQEVALLGSTDIASRLAVADIDGDGDLDFAVSGGDASGNSIVWVRLNGGDASGSNTGIFSGSQQLVGKRATGLAFGDMDADGDQDLVMATTSSRALVYLNGGDASGSNTGVFGNGTSMATGAESYAVSLADADGDGDLDVLTADYNAGTITVGLNQPPAPLIASISPTKGVAGTVVTLAGSNFAGTTVKVGGVAAPVTANTGTSLTFAVPVGASAAGGVTVANLGGAAAKPFAVELRVKVAQLKPAPNSLNFNSTLLEVGLTEPATYSSADYLAVYAPLAGGQRSGYAYSTQTGLQFFASRAIAQAGFQPGEEITVSAPATILSQGGIKLSSYVYRFTAGVYGLGRGNFQPGSELEVGAAPLGCATADLDGDGDLDVATVSLGSTGITTVKLVLNQGQGTFVAGAEVVLAGNPGVRDLAAVDIDLDGDLDLLTANALTNNIGVLANNGRGSFTAQPALAAGSAPQQLAYADVDADGRPDLLVLSGSTATVRVCLNQGYNYFTTGTDVAVGAGAQALATGDVDGDGDLDLLTSNGSSQTVSVRLNSGSGVFGGTTNLALGTAPAALALGDVDGDGDLDLVLASPGTSTVDTWLNNGSGTFSSATKVAVGSAVPGSFQLADLDADADLDLLVTLPGAGSVAAWLNDGKGGFAPGSTVAVGTSPASLRTADVDGDGDLDLLTANRGATTLSVRLNQAYQPTITSFTPTSGPAGTVVTVTGTNLLGATEMRIGSVPIASFKVVSATSLTFEVPTGGTVSGLVTVVTAAGTGSSAVPFGTVLTTASGQAPARIQLYPNPALTSLTVQLPTAGAAQVALRDVAGRLLLPLAALPASGQLLLPSTLAAGVYLLEVQQGGTTTTHRFVKQ